MTAATPAGARLDPGLPRRPGGRPSTPAVDLLVRRHRVAALGAARGGRPVPHAAAGGRVGVRQGAGGRRPGGPPPRPRLDRPPGGRRPGGRARRDPRLDLPRRRGDALPRRLHVLPDAGRRRLRPWRATGRRSSTRSASTSRRRTGTPRSPSGRRSPGVSRRSARCRTSSASSRTVACGSCSSGSTSPTDRSGPTPTSPPPTAPPTPPGTWRSVRRRRRARLLDRPHRAAAVRSTA